VSYNGGRGHSSSASIAVIEGVKVTRGFVMSLAFRADMERNVSWQRKKKNKVYNQNSRRLEPHSEGVTSKSCA